MEKKKKKRTWLAIMTIEKCFRGAGYSLYLKSVPRFTQVSVVTKILPVLSHAVKSPTQSLEMYSFFIN
jgi:hypothetical protein